MKIYYTDKFEGGRTESHRMLEEALSEYTGDAAGAGKLVTGLMTGEKGKPYIEGFDHFSISHTGSIWAVLIAECECGLDVQLVRKCNVKAIAKRIFAPEDRTAVFEYCENEHDNNCSANESKTDGSGHEFFRLWCRREALVKALGGSVYETDLPSVQPDRLIVNGKTYMLADITIPGLTEIYASVCTRGCGLHYSSTDVFSYLGDKKRGNTD